MAEDNSIQKKKIKPHQLIFHGVKLKRVLKWTEPFDSALSTFVRCLRPRLLRSFCVEGKHFTVLLVILSLCCVLISCFLRSRSYYRHYAIAPQASTKRRNPRIRRKEKYLRVEITDIGGGVLVTLRRVLAEKVCSDPRSYSCRHTPLSLSLTHTASLSDLLLS